MLSSNPSLAGKRVLYFNPKSTSEYLRVLVMQSCPTLCNPMFCSPPGSSAHGVLQARILEWVATSFSRGSSRPRDLTQVSCIADRFFTSWATREAPGSEYLPCARYFIRCWVIWGFKKIAFPSIEALTEKENNLMESWSCCFSSICLHPTVLCYNSPQVPLASQIIPILFPLQAPLFPSIPQMLVCFHALYFVFFSLWYSYSPRVISYNPTWWLKVVVVVQPLNHDWLFRTSWTDCSMSGSCVLHYLLEFA